MQKLVARLRQAWPEVVITLRADSGFCRDNLMSWCEANNVRFVFGLPQNQRLLKVIGREQQEAKGAFEQSGHASRVFTVLMILGLHVSDADELVRRTPRGGQGGAALEGAEPALHRHQHPCDRARGA